MTYQYLFTRSTAHVAKTIKPLHSCMDEEVAKRGVRWLLTIQQMKTCSGKRRQMKQEKECFDKSRVRLFIDVVSRDTVFGTWMRDGFRGFGSGKSGNGFVCLAYT